MSLMAKLDQELKQAMLTKDADRLSTLRLLKSAIKYAAIEKPGSVMGDTEIVQVIRKQIKQRRESIQQFSEGGRRELAAREEAEVRVLESYLPEQISADALKTMVEQEVKAQGAAAKKDFGRMMKYLGEKLAGRADNKRLSEILGQLLK